MMPGRFPLSLLLLAASPAALMLPTPAAMAADAGAAVPSDVVAEHYAAQLEANYVYPEIGKRYAAALREGIAAGRYAPLTGAALAEALGATVQGVSPDGHLRVKPPESADAAPGAPLGNEGPAVLHHLGPGNRHATESLRHQAQHRVVAMATRASVDAEGGSPIDGIPSMRPVAGDPAMVTREHWATPNGDARLTQAKVYVLTSGASASAAEHFALAMKASGRGVLIGAPTGGANHFGRGEELGGGFTAFIPVGRTYDPATGKDWEGDGVQPDIAVPAAAALERALTELGIAPGEAKRLSDAHMPSWPMERRRRPGASGG